VVVRALGLVVIIKSSTYTNSYQPSDVLKLYGQSWCEIKSLVHTVNYYFNDICTDVGEAKCNVVAVARGHIVPSRTHISSICHKQYNDVKEQVSVSLESTSSVALTTDIWTSRTVQPYITVTVHFLTENWILDSRVLVCNTRNDKIPHWCSYC